ncbi:MAG: hypothetical protein IJJ44_11100 [Solobacterium sp.]|nr:hypothetical protein [Solobacterium sp.]
MKTKTQMDKIKRKDLIHPLLEHPGNVVYFETQEGLYGIVSSGDVHRTEGEYVTINRNFTQVEQDEPMHAREVFRSRPAIREIPAMRDGQLSGEFQAADDELLLERAVPFSRNAYAPGYFTAMRSTALVIPAQGHAYKSRYFEHMKDVLDEYRAEYTVLTLREMMERFDEFETFLMVDAPEKKGALFLLYLLRGKKYYYRILTYLNLTGKLESAEVMDYEEVFRGFQTQGIELIFMTAIRKNNEYMNRTEKAMRSRFPTEYPQNLNELVMPYAEKFFDDLYGLEGYVDNILNGYFVVEKDEEQMRLRDTKSRYVNVSAGKRITVDQPAEYERTIWFYGPCLVIGSYEGDEYTIESWLQKRINACGYKVKVENCGCWGGNMATLSRMVSTPFRKGDVIVGLMEDLDIRFPGVQTMDLWETLEEYQVPAEWLLDTPYHVNHHVTRMYADKLFEVIFRNIGEAGREPVPYHFDFIDKFFIKKYFYGVDLTQYRTAACIVANGNPFTAGHRYLVETAARETEHVYLLVLKENSSLFSFAERYAMAVEALRDLENVTVIPSGLFIGDVASFPAYYAKIYTPDTKELSRQHVRTYASVAVQLHVTHRYIGEEPNDPITNEINRACLEILPEYGIETVILTRKTDGGQPLTGSYIREIASGDEELLRRCVPETTADIILCKTINVY